MSPAWSGLELVIVSSIILGGTLGGGRGNILGTLAGVLIKRAV